MRRYETTCAMTAAMLLLGPAAWAVEEETVLYQLGTAADFTEDCVGPCLCPFSITTGLTGTFTVTPDQITGVLDVYTVDGIAWTAAVGGGPGAEVSITGSGTYRTFTELVTTHQLELDLTVGDNPPQHFDSGIVLGGADFPDIDITISIDGIFCPDLRLTVDAGPASQCPDLDGSGDVGFNELLTVLSSWGPCPGKSACPADFDGTGDVGFTDLLVILTAWGPCP